MKKVQVSKEVAVALDTLLEMCAGFHYEMYVKMNQYLFNQASDYQNPLLEPLRTANLFDVVDAIRYGYTSEPFTEQAGFILTKEQYVLERVSSYSHMCLTEKRNMKPATLKELIEQWSFDYEVEKYHRPEMLFRLTNKQNKADCETSDNTLGTSENISEESNDEVAEILKNYESMNCPTCKKLIEPTDYVYLDSVSLIKSEGMCYHCCELRDKRAITGNDLIGLLERGKTITMVDNVTGQEYEGVVSSQNKTSVSLERIKKHKGILVFSFEHYTLKNLETVI